MLTPRRRRCERSQRRVSLVLFEKLRTEYKTNSKEALGDHHLSG
jgi:hypothetical protein